MARHLPEAAAALTAPKTLAPPRLIARAEVRLGPSGEHKLVIFRHVSVGQRQGERSRAAHNLAGVVILRTVAGADELVLASVPGHNATQVGANGVEAVVCHTLVIGDDNVGRIAFEALRQDALTSA